ncbi:hypothetical protein G9C98_008266 [Cotesia typhae]|uniref:Uncharacterized protein n=1 Tax=Cotesia typhae TaxID=2053667 RepID=A0A8J5QZP7_9HYME|nr:hypothetical protein G9C98_008266 [Cotesia typhae]
MFDKNNPPTEGESVVFFITKKRNRTGNYVF